MYAIRSYYVRVREPLDLVDVVGGDQFARAGFREIRERVDAGQLPFVECVIQRLTVRAAREGRMRLVADARPDLDVVVAERDRLDRRVVGQRLAVGVAVVRDRLV